METCDEWQYSWSPDGDRIAVALWNFEEGDGSDLVIYDLVWVDGVATIVGETVLDDSPTHPLHNTMIYWIEWSNAGDHIVLSAKFPDAGDQYDLWVIEIANPDAPVQLTSTPDWERWPTWSPDDTQIAYHYDAPGPVDSIKVIPAAGGAAVTLVEGRYVNNPDWWAGG
jgi:Tol biopolymer transport system component